MKFAKELEDDLVPEWRVKYFNYKTGKKKIKAVSRALKSVNRTPNFARRPAAPSARSTDALPFTHYDFTRRNELSEGQDAKAAEQRRGGNAAQRPPLDSAMRRESITMFARSPPVLMPNNMSQSQQPSGTQSPAAGERQPLQQNEQPQERSQYSYGSFSETRTDQQPSNRLPELELPDPALDPSQKKSQTIEGVIPSRVSKPVESSPDAYHVGPQSSPRKKLGQFSKTMFKRSSNYDGRSYSQSKLKQVFRTQPLDTPKSPDVDLESYRVLDARQDDFFNFLDKELEKIETFYQSKEDDASERLDVLREQLHEMRDRRLQDVETAKRGGKIADDGVLDGQIPILSTPTNHKANGSGNGHAHDLLKPMNRMLKNESRIGKTTKAMGELGSPPGPAGKNKHVDSNKDYVKRKVPHEHVPYRFAKRRLKLALQEFYRGLELLKSYALLNRTAFRKINKKYDKAVNARPTLQYMAEKVNNAHFVKSSVIESLLVSVEDLYARYFERGNHKVAVNKLKSKLRQGNQSSVSFRNGLYVAAGACFGVAGIVNASRDLFSTDPGIKTQTSYLLQIYAGYFLAVLLFLIFVLDCRIWTRARVNYTFVFEFDTRHVLDWRQLAELPCLFLFLNGLFVWLNFEFGALHAMYVYWPVILIGLTLLIITFPGRVLYYYSRKWFGYSNWRLLLAGLYPVEFRDFFMGDMYCSETYTLSQISLFFCLYARHWNDPAQCNSSHSMLLGFFTALPAVWRANQCLRRYYDTRNWFPHLANFAKYLCNILYYMTLSLYRLKINDERKAVFIVFALINGLYASTWDIFMDWSLGNPYAKHRFLRDQLAFRRVWVYYFAIVVNVVFRQQWIFYAIFTSDLQHSAFMSFCVGLMEVLRRGLWSIFRVENEHCNNVKQFRASRDVPLPYDISHKAPPDHKGRPGKHKKDDLGNATHADPHAPGSGVGTAVDLERASTRDTNGTQSSSLRQRKGSTTPGLSALRRVGTVIAAAHAQDFQKKRRPEVTGAASDEGDKNQYSSDDDDDSDDISIHTEDNDMEDSIHSDYGSPRARPQGSNDDSKTDKGDGVGSTSRPSASQRRSGGAEQNSGNRTPEQGKGGPEDGDENVRYLDISSPRQQTRDSADAEEENEADLIEVRKRIDRARSPG